MPQVVTITLPDAYSRESLMRAITTSIRLALVSGTDARNGDNENIVPLVDLLDKLLPDEEELLKKDKKQY
jgi:hypothetical protein